MKFRNPRIPEGINTSSEHPLKEFVILLAAAVLLIVLLAWLLGSFGGQRARQLPFEHESALVPVGMLDSDAGSDLQGYLDALAARLVAEMALPDGMQIRLHFSADDTFNAFATLGGNVLLYRGLVESLPHENALAMLIAHEIAHVVHRDPIVGIGRAAAVQLVFGLLLGNPNLSVLGNAGIYTQLHFSREMERDADAAALAAVNAVYGHVAGARDLFLRIRAERERAGVGEPPAIFNSHPLDAQRRRAIAELARRRGWSPDGATTPLPAAFAAWVRASSASAAASGPG